MLSKPFLLSIENEDDLKVVRDAYEQKINDSVLKINCLTEELEALKKFVDNYREKIKQIDNHLNPSHGKPVKAVPEITREQPKLFRETFTPGMTKAAQAEYALKKSGKPLSTRDIVETLLLIDPGLLSRDNTTFDKFQKAMAATLVQKVAAKNTFSSSRDAITETVKYSLREWEKAGG